MERGEWFDLRGNYRVQSKNKPRPSRLAGYWAEPSSADLNSSVINACLHSDPQWRGRAVVDIRPALVELRGGEFASEPDILYKRTNFERDENSEAIPSDVIDVRKASMRWNQRRSFASSLINHENLSKIERIVGDVERIAALEYYVHEAGHCVGYDTDSKYRDGYFKIAGKTVWPLVYVEEFRADLLGFGFAASLLPAETVAAVFFYNFLLRLSSHVEGIKQQGYHPYGVIPLLLYATLRQSGFIGAPVNKDGRLLLNFKTFTSTEIVHHAHRCADFARSNAVEADAEKGPDAAIRAATFYRSILRDKIVGEFEEIVCSSLASDERTA